MSERDTLFNRQWRLASRPTGLPRDTDWQFTTEPVAPPAEGGILVRVEWVSLDPAMRGWMDDARSYIAPVAIGAVMRAGGIGRVLASRSDRFAVGDLVSGEFGVQEYCSVDAARLGRLGVRRIDPSLGTPPQWLNVLGMPGMTAYFGLREVGRPSAGETLVVSAAAGAVGQTVGQIGKVLGLRVVGIAGGPEKCRWVVDELGFDACIDYKAPPPPDAARWNPVREGLKRHCPDGVDIYFDNVGGDVLDAVLARIRRGARIVVCGAISQYNASGPVAGPKNYLSLLVNRARMEGMVVLDYADRYAEAVAELAGWLREGRIVSREDVVRGIEQFPQALLRLFDGRNFGKLVLQLV